MLKFLASFALGVYAGIYIDQNYKVPSVSDPNSLYEEVKKMLEKFEKGGKSDK